MSAKKNKRMNKQNQELVESLKETVEFLNLVEEDMMQAANIIMYQEGKIDAYRECLGLNE